MSEETTNAGSVAKAARLHPDLRSVLFRMRRHLRPWGMAAALVAAGFSAEAVAALSAEQLLVTTVTVTSAGASSLIAANMARRTSTRKARKLLIGGLSSTVWLGLAATGGVTVPLFAALLLGTLSASGRYWHTVRIPQPQAALCSAPDRPALEQGSGGELTRYVKAWDEHVHPMGGALPGALLELPERFEHGIAHQGQLARGKQDFGTLMYALPKIATALDVPQENLVPDRDRKRPSRFTLKVVLHSPIEESVLFDGPRYDNGKILLGPHADGLGDAFYRLYVPDGIRGGAIYGGSGIGKSRLIEVIALTAQACTPTVIFYIDGQDGNSSTALWENATWSGGPDYASAMLRSIESIQRYRQRYNKYHRLDGFTPTPEFPGILVIVDECHRIFNTKNAQRWGYLAREGRKVGIGILAATQNPNSTSMGGEEALRQSLQDGNCLLMRMRSHTASIVVPGIDIDLSRLPAMPGYAVPANSGSTDYGRNVPFRSRWLLTSANIEADPSLAGNLTVHDWFARTAKTDLDVGSSKAAGGNFLDRHTIAEQIRAELEQEMQNPGLDVDFDDTDDEQDTSAAAMERSSRSNVVAFPTVGEPARSSGEADIHDLTPGEVHVLMSIGEGRTTPAEWQDELSESGARKCRDSLMNRGLVERLGHGQYALTEPGRRFVALGQGLAREAMTR